MLQDNYIPDPALLLSSMSKKFISSNSLPSLFQSHSLINTFHPILFLKEKEEKKEKKRKIR